MTKSPSRNELAALILAETLATAYPRVAIESLGVSRLGFYCKASFAKAPGDLLESLDELIRGKIREDLPIQHTSRLADNVRVMIKEKGLTACRPLFQGLEGAIEVAELGSFISPFSAQEVTSTGDVGVIKLLSQSSLEEEGDRFVLKFSGVAFDSTQKLKEFLKAYKEYEKNSVVSAYKKRGVLKELPNGEWVKAGEIVSLYDKLAEVTMNTHLKEGATPIVSPLEGRHCLEAHVGFLKENQQTVEMVRLPFEQNPSEQPHPFCPCEAAVDIRFIPTDREKALYHLKNAFITTSEFLRHFNVEGEWRYIEISPKEALPEVREKVDGDGIPHGDRFSLTSLEMRALSGLVLVGSDPMGQEFLLSHLLFVKRKGEEDLYLLQSLTGGLDPFLLQCLGQKRS